MQRLAPGVWLVPGQGADADARNRGQVVHLLVAQDGPRTWVVGSGPTPAFGRRLRCAVAAAAGGAELALITPLAQAEVALGAAGLEPAEHWAHERVAAAMAEQCPHCVDRLRQRLGSAAADLGDDPVRLPGRLLHGGSGAIGPFDWWALPRSADRVALVLRHRATGIGFAPGLLWGDGPPDLRDTDVASMATTLQRLQRLAGEEARWWGHQGPPLSAGEIARQAAYVGALWQAARAAVASGSLGVPAADGPGHERHDLNRQRAWRQAEDESLREPRR